MQYVIDSIATYVMRRIQREDPTNSVHALPVADVCVLTSAGISGKAYPGHASLRGRVKFAFSCGVTIPIWQTGGECA